MEMKESVILLIFLLSVVGLLIGAYNTEASDNTEINSGSAEIIYEDSNGNIIIHYIDSNDESVVEDLIT